MLPRIPRLKFYARLRDNSYGKWPHMRTSRAVKILSSPFIAFGLKVATAALKHTVEM